MFNKTCIINNAVSTKTFADSLGLYDNFYRNAKDFKNGFKVKRFGNGFFIILPEWFIKIIDLGYDCYALKSYDSFEYEFEIELTKKTSLGFFKNDKL